jgi:TPR repeat protein
MATSRAAYSFRAFCLVAALAVVWLQAPMTAGAQGADRYADTRKRVALLVAAGSYQAPGLKRLPNPPNDVQMLKARLVEVGFSVATAIDPTLAELRTAIATFARNGEGADIGVVYLSGHGMQIDGENYFLPVDFNPGSGDARADLIHIGALLQELEVRIKAKVLLLDACRDNPLASLVQAKSATRSIGVGLAPIQVSVPQNVPKDEVHGLVIGYATQPNTVARDGPAGTTSPYVAGLLEGLKRPDEDISSLLVRAAAFVVDATGGEQRPEARVALTQPVYLLSRAAPLPCDLLAAHPDNNVFVAGVELDTIDPAKAVPACRAAVAANPTNPRLIYNLARSLERQGAAREAMELYRRSAEIGYEHAQNDLGNALLLGRGVRQDVPEALNMLSRAHRQGNRKALITYAMLDRSGLFERSTRRASALQSALQGEGLLPPPHSGKLDQRTRAAVEVFKRVAGVGGQGITFEVIHMLGLADQLKGD